MRRWFCLLAVAFTLTSRGARPAHADTVTLPDSTTVETFTLPNGLRVVLRNVSLTDRIAVVVAYGTGLADDPRDRGGLANLLAEIRFFGGVPDAPARTLGQMEAQRPAGWELAVQPHLTRMTEVATLPQFPGVIHQVAARMRGAPVDDRTLKAALASTSFTLAANYRDTVASALYYDVRAIADGATAADLARLASGAGLQKLTPRDVNAFLAERFVPGRAVLSLAGNFATYPVRRIVENEFGAISGGAPVARHAPAPLDSASFSVVNPALQAPAGAIAIIAPALTDSSHASFFAATLVLGAVCIGDWGHKGPGNPFHYSLFDDAQLAHFSPPIEGKRDPLKQVLDNFAISIGDARNSKLPSSAPQDLWRGVDWLLGGPMPPEVIEAVREPNGGLGTLASTAAARELLGGEAFWSGYRERFKAAFLAPLGAWIAYFESPVHRVELALVPGPKPR